MLDRVGEWATALTGVVSLPVWAVVGIGAVLVLACALAFVRAGGEGRSVPVVVLVLIVALAGWWARDHFARRDLEAEQRALDTRAFELATRAFMPGSALGCLDAIAGETVEEACEKAVFASPEATAAAVSYVAAQLSLLVSARDLGRAGRTNSATLALRRAVEADRFGIVAHVLAVRDGCTPNQCAAFGFLQGTGRVSANLAERPFEAHVTSHMAAWQSSGARPVAGASPPAMGAPGSVSAGKPASSAYFPSSASIPQVNIIAAEPPASQPSRDTTAAAAAAEPASPRKPPANPPLVRQPSNSNSGAAASGPLQLAPNAQ
jgi:hypothetical protein